MPFHINTTGGNLITVDDIVQAHSQQFLGVLFENVDLKLQPIKVQEQKFVVCALLTFMRVFNKQFHTQMKFESVFLTTCP